MDSQQASPTTLNQIQEAGLLKILQSYGDPEIMGDDGAVLKSPPGDLVVTTDVLVENVHFSDRSTPADAVGWRATAANLSDLAAMGASPTALVIGLGLPGHTSVQWVKGLYGGIQRCCQTYGTALVGGDTCRSASRFVSITALGYVSPDRAIRRRYAQPGDRLLATGPHGSSRAGLELLLHPQQPTDLDPETQELLIRAHQYPCPRLDVIAALQDLEVPRVAGMDTSDGLADALIQICGASQVRAVVDPEQIPMEEALRRGFPEQALNWALYGGEDFELLLSLPASEAEDLIRQVPGLIQIGEVTGQHPQGQVEIQGMGVLDRDQAFQHFTVEPR